MGNNSSSRRFQDLLDRAREEYPNGMNPHGPINADGRGASESYAFEILTSKSYPMPWKLLVALGNYAQCHYDFHHSSVHDEIPHHHARESLRYLNECISTQNERVEVSGEDATVHCVNGVPTDMWDLCS